MRLPSSSVSPSLSVCFQEVPQQSSSNPRGCSRDPKTSALIKRSRSRALFGAMLAFTLLLLFNVGADAQSLNFDNNFFVTGDYVVAGAYNMNQVVTNGMTTGTITVPDTQNPNTGALNIGNTGPTSVPVGAQIVAALLYWETVESTSNIGAGKSGSFGVAGQNGYPITGVPLTGQSTVSWSNGGCPGTSTGRAVSVYRADVRGLLPQDANGNITPNTTYQITLPSSSNGSTPITLGASLVLVYRILSPAVPLNSIVIYDGAYGQTSGQLTMSQTIQGFYDADVDATRVSRLTHIVGSGQANKYQTAYLNGQVLPNLYGGLAAFPGWYGNWDNPTWTFTSSQSNPIKADDASATTTVIPSASQQGCVVWGAVIVGTTVNNPDGDGLLKSWKTGQNGEPGYCDAAITSKTSPPTACQGPSDPSWVDLPGATLGEKDVFVQLDYLCSNKVAGQNACDLSQPGSYSFDPSLAKAPDGKTVVQKVIDSFAGTGTLTMHSPVNVHVFPTWAIQEQTCTDTTDSNGNPVLCEFPNQPGVVGWKAGFTNVKNQFLKNDGSGDACTDSTGATCIMRFEHGRKDSWHYALFAHALATPRWGFLSGLTDSSGNLPAKVYQSGNTVTFYTSTAHGLVVDPNAGNGRVIISAALSNPNLNGIFLVSTKTCPQNPVTLALNDCSLTNTAPGPYAFTITLATSAGAQPTYTKQSDPNLSIAPGQAGKSSGFSDLGGADSLITLGSWPATDQTWNAKAGVFMHELGHGLGLSHGGLYYDQAANNYTPTFEVNCKSNFLSIMNYAFTVDLLDNQYLDFSGGVLQSLNEGSSLSAGQFSAAPYSNTSWYAPTYAGDPHAAARHCDGSPILDGATMVRKFDLASNFSFIAPQDVNFDGNSAENLRGYSDWSSTPATPGIDLRQTGATGSLSVFGGPSTISGGPSTISGGPSTISGGPSTISGGPSTISGGPSTISGGPSTISGGPSTISGGPGDFTHEMANSYARPATGASASEAVSPRSITVVWNAPIFGSPDHYNVYRSAAGGAFSLIATIGRPNGNTLPTTTYTDTVTCNQGGYRYYIVSVVLDDITNQPLVSTPSNTTNNSPLLTGCYTDSNAIGTVSLTSLKATSNPVTAGSTVPITWTLQDDDTLVNVQNLAANKRLMVIGPISNDLGCSNLLPPPPVTGYQGTYPYPVTTLASNGNGIQMANNHFTFSWNLAAARSKAGCYFFEADLDSGQTEVSQSALTVLMWVSGSAPFTLTTALPNATLNKSYSTTLQQTGGVASPFTWTVVSGALPPGILLNSTNGTLSGKPSTTGSYGFGIKATDGAQNYGTQNFTLSVCKQNGC